VRANKSGPSGHEARRTFHGRFLRRVDDRALAHISLAAALILIAMTTLWPLPEQTAESARTPLFCLPCGDTGTADSVLNVLLFIPLGLALVWAGAPLWLAALVCALTTTTVEVFQFFLIPGRDAAFADTLANTLGGGMGGILATRWRALLFPTRTRGVTLLVIGVLWVIVALMGSALLLQPSLPRPPWFGQWAVSGEDEGWFEGKVHNVELGGHRVPHGQIVDANDRRETLLKRPVLLAATVTSGPSRHHPQRILSIATKERPFLTLLQADRDLYFEVRSKAANLRLHSPIFQLCSGFPTTADDTVMIEGRLWRGRGILSVSRQGVRRESQASLTVFDGWRTLRPIPVGAPIGRGITWLWIGALLMPIGWLSVGRPPGLLAGLVVLVLAVSMTSSLVGTLPLPSAIEWAVAVSWALVGRLTCLRLQQRE